MSYEIEAKIRVANLETVAETLGELSADFSQKLRQVDRYFMDTGKGLRKNDCALRIRHQIANGEQSAVMTFKGPRLDGRFKNRVEYETGIADAETAEKIFESLGYHKAVEVEKKRSIWLLDGCEVCLDELPRLGCFVEVEGPDEATITGVLAKLGLENQPHITESYAAMIARNQKQE